MIILGIDPGYARVGFAVIDLTNGVQKAIECGSITTSKDEKLCTRLNKIANDLQEIIDKYNMDFAAIEDLFFNTNTKTAIHVAEARGVILYILEKNNIQIAEYTPLQVKQALVGYGRADKNQVKNMVQKILGFKIMPKLDDTTDAIAIAICHSFSYKYNNLQESIKVQKNKKIQK